MAFAHDAKDRVGMLVTLPAKRATWVRFGAPPQRPSCRTATLGQQQPAHRQLLSRRGFCAGRCSPQRSSPLQRMRSVPLSPSGTPEAMLCPPINRPAHFGHERRRRLLRASTRLEEA